MKKKKILFRIGSFQGGGAEKVLSVLLNHLNPEKYEVQVLLNSKRGIYLKDIPNWVELKHIVLGDDQLTHLNKIQYLFYKLFRRLKAEFYKANPAKLYGKILDKDYDIEIAFLQDITPEVFKSPIKNSKKIAWVHTDMVMYETRFPKISKKIKAVLNQFDAVISVSESANQRTKEFLGVEDSDKFQVIYNPLDMNLVRQQSKNSDGLFDANHINVLSIGRLQPVKGMDRIVDLAKNLVNHSLKEKVKFHIIGKGEMEKEISQKIKEFGLKDVVKLHGYVSPPYQYLKEADIVLVPSWHEGFSLVIAEALSLNKVILSTNAIGPKELLKNGEYGMVVENTNDALLKGLLELIQNKEKYEQYLKSTMEKTFEFEVKQVIQKVEKLFDTI